MSATGRRRPVGMGLPGEQGFTLIEALVTVAIAALIAGLGFPSLQRTIVFWQYRTAAAQVEGALARARGRAVRGDVIVRVAAVGDGGAYALSGERPAALPPGARLAVTGGSAIDFYPDGSSSGGSVRLSVGRQAALFAVAAATGLVDRRP